MSNTIDQILDAAERRMRAAGYHAVSYRDVAADIGVKSASVHYHFPKKHDLGAALVRRYQERFFGALDALEEPSAVEALEAFVGQYDDALVLGKSICLCAMFGAESIALPDVVRDEVRAFFDRCTGWLAPRLRAVGVDDEESVALRMVSALEGGMVVASVTGERRAFDACVAWAAEAWREPC